jgi:hypothetical protein
VLLATRLVGDLLCPEKRWLKGARRARDQCGGQRMTLKRRTAPAARRDHSSTHSWAPHFEHAVQLERGPQQ